MKKVWKKLFDVLDDILAYILTLLGILLSNGLSMMKNNEVIKLDFSLLRIILSAAVSLLLVAKQEQVIIIEVEGKKIRSNEAKEGRKRNFINRMANALAQGFMWAQLSNLTGE